MNKIKRLTAGDICKGTFNQGEKHCAVGWMIVAGVQSNTNPISLYEDLRVFLKGDKDSFSIFGWNDHTDPAVVADTLNRFLEARGLLEGVG